MRLSRVVRQVAAIFLLALICTSLARAADRASKLSVEIDGTSSPAVELVRRALEAEATGDAERRAAYLKDALAADPNYAPAHWQSGEVRTGERWLRITDVAAAATRDGEIAQYRQMRDRSANTATGQLSLAHWCVAAGLKDQERFHLVSSMQFQPTKKQSHEIIRKLGLVRHQGRLMPPAQAELLKADEKRIESGVRDWKVRLARLRRDIDSRDVATRKNATDELLAIRDPASIPALEAVFSKSTPEAGKAAVAVLKQVPEQMATDSLVRFAIFAAHDGLREAAVTALQSRPLYGYVPMLVEGLESLVDVQFTVDSQGGFPHHRLQLSREGPAANYSVIHQDGVHENMTYGLTTHRIWFNGMAPDTSLEQDALTAQQELAANDIRGKMNARIAQVLGAATGNDFNADPITVWKWWLDYNEMYQPEYKPEIQAANTYQAISWRYIISCFPAGTPVESSTGPLPIEQIKPGDCVLAQDPDSGQLAYKPVMAVTLRPPSPLIEVRTANETIRATRGHPFWVSGIGWQMAKELKAGQWLHTTAGPVQIESAEQQGEAECHNLVVADFNSYFVGQQQILVHDNNLRQVTTAIVPGLVNP